MSYLNALITILWASGILILLKSVFEKTQFWQRKEYRVDRVISGLKDNVNKKKRREFILPAIYVIAFFTALSYFKFQHPYFFAAPLFIFVINIHRSLKIFAKLIFFKLDFPAKSIRNLIIVLVTFVIILIPIYQSYSFISANKETIEINFDFKNNEHSSGTFIEEFQNRAKKFEISDIKQPLVIPIDSFFVFLISIEIMILDALIFFIIGALSLLTEPFARRRRQQIIKEASQKIRRYRNLKIIGITGSYGKTSTKEILQTILSHKFETTCTDANMNTQVGIALSILKNVNDSTEVFIAEAGAYQRYEILEALEFWKPDIGIVTNVGKAHLDIFKTVENISEAKYELVESIKPNGTAILNYDNNFTRLMAAKSDKKNFFFSIEPEAKRSGDLPDRDDLLIIYNVRWEGSKLSFTLKFNDKKESFETHLYGRQQLPNLAAAMLTAIKMDISFYELKKILAETVFELSHFKIYNGRNNVKIIDDSYNSNPEGFESALLMLQESERKKRIVITKGIPEIGKEISGIYEDLAEKISDSANILFTTDRMLADKMIRGHKRVKTVFCKDDREIRRLIGEYINEQCIILIEGRVNPKLVKFLNS